MAKAKKETNITITETNEEIPALFNPVDITDELNNDLWDNEEDETTMSENTLEPMKESEIPGTVEQTEEHRGRKYEYIDKAEIGMFVAFRNIDGRIFSAKLMEKLPDDKAKLETKNGSVYFVDYCNIIWVKTGRMWPPGIYNAMRQHTITK